MPCCTSCSRVLLCCRQSWRTVGVQTRRSELNINHSGPTQLSQLTAASVLNCETFTSHKTQCLLFPNQRVTPQSPTVNPFNTTDILLTSCMVFTGVVRRTPCFTTAWLKTVPCHWLRTFPVRVSVFIKQMSNKVTTAKTLLFELMSKAPQSQLSCACLKKFLKFVILYR